MIEHSKNNFRSLILGQMVDDEAEYKSDFEEEEIIDDDDLKTPEVLPILPLRNTVLFPGVVVPISVGRDKSIKLIKDIYKKNKLVGAVAQLTPDVDDPDFGDLYTIGTVAQIIKVLELPDNSTSIIIQGRSRFVINEAVSHEPYLMANVTELDELVPEVDQEFEALISTVKETAGKIVQLSPNLPQEAFYAIKNIDNPVFLINFISSNTDISVEDKQLLLDIEKIDERAMKLLQYMNMEIQKLELKDNIQNKVKQELDQQQREYYLNQQMKTIQTELGGSQAEQDLKEIYDKAVDLKWNDKVKEHFEKEAKRLERTNPASPEYSNQLNYLESLTELPWNLYTQDNFDLKRAQAVLDEDHFGLEQVKERIMEHLAVLKMKGDMKAPIICLYGPPGVGKTSLGRSVAKALDRKYIRMSLGGLHDEAEIRGHRRTYIGAMPGRIIQSLKKAQTANPVFILDEIDKVGSDFRGDPSSALLEVLDPEQNGSFYDNYLEVDFDLSKVLFIATANSLSDIKHALRDRMEIINITGYIVEEKLEIAKRHLLPKQMEEHGLKPEQLILSNEVLEDIILNYTRESGVRELEKKVAKVVRNITKRIGMEEAYNPEITIEDIRKILGQQEYTKGKYAGNEYAGVVTGLAWTAVGGEILVIETSLSKGKSGNLTLTGNLGNVMKESAVIALEYIKAHASDLEIPEEVFEKWNIHLHVPEGAIPKDGPSAGITMATAMASAYTQRKVKKNLAMTGEITLRGKVLPVGGIKEKILAAKRAEIKEIILSKENEKDIKDIKPVYLKGLKFHYVNSIMEVFDIALMKQKVAKPITLS